ncbi:ATP-binding protein [Dasania marina]|uniref:Lon protease family protein n=1 Tax=Dasania marina TaxID=471499 RepID=UPI0030D814A8
MKLSAEQLRSQVSEQDLGFQSTRELSHYSGILGQARVTKALDFGLAINQPGYNIYIAGEAGASRFRYALDYLQPLVGQQQTPPDWLYVNNFDNPYAPRMIKMPPGQGCHLHKDIDKLIDALIDTFPATFDNPSYQQRKSAIQNRFDQIYDDAIASVQNAASQQQIAMFSEDGSVTFTPIIDGKVIDESQFASLNQEQLSDFRQHVNQFEELLNDALLELPQWQRDFNDQQRQLRESTIEQALKPILQPLRQSYQGNTAISLFLAQIGKHLPRVIEENFSDQNKNEAVTPSKQRKLLESYYTPNLLTSAIKDGAPIVLESNPSYQNLFGRVSYGSEDSGGAYQQITPGALHRANGGYLILDAEKLLSGEGTWPALKRMLRDSCIHLEPPPGDIQLSGVTPLHPEPVPLQVKVILIGSRNIYYNLDQLDRDFNDLFRVLVDFDDYIDSNPQSLKQFAELLHTRSSEANIAELSAAAVARLAEHAHRLAEHQQRLSARIDAILEVAVEADFERLSSGQDIIDGQHIQLAIAARWYRNARLRDQLLKQIIDGTVVISSDGSTAGQINGLSLLQVGEMTFGCPTRITASVNPGHRGVIDIEREAELGQSVHSKGVMILTGYLSSFYTQKIPLAISAHIAMEQSYGYIDGDSASLGELCALLSALVNQPLRQDLAITGSTNQRGEVQAIGGVNEKIESFFDVCAARGLTGNQGVILPASNKNNLMLEQRVVDAVAQGQFSIYTVSTVNEALALLIKKDPGKINQRGNFPKGTFNDRVVKQLEYFARITRSISPSKAKSS